MVNVLLRNEEMDAPGGMSTVFDARQCLYVGV